MGELGNALENGQIGPWFQPQISADTGQVDGLEALARWDHPNRGVVLARDFVQGVAEHGLNCRLSEVMVGGALSTLASLDRQGKRVATVSVKFTAIELAEARLPDRIRWELDRFDLAPGRLRAEIREDAIAAVGDDVIAANIAALAKMGCLIDLDNFGNGQASISHLRRFPISRIKISRQLVARADRDKDQQAMINAVLTLAENLSLGTIAEGVETSGEHALLAQLGCGSVQGHSIAGPMRAADLPAWIEKHQSRLNSLTPHAGVLH